MKQSLQLFFSTIIQSPLMILNSNNVYDITRHYEAVSSSLGNVVIEPNSRAFVNVLKKEKYISSKAESS